MLLPEMRGEGHMIIECASCRMRDLACHDCVVSVLLGPPGALDGSAGPGDSGMQPGMELGVEERAAIAVLASSGLVPPLRLLTSEISGGTSHPVLRRSSGGDEPPKAVGAGV